MNNIKTKFSAAVAMAVVIAGTLAPAALAKGGSQDVTIINKTTRVNVTQKNKSLIVNGVVNLSNTGGNKTNGNTGGEVTTKTGTIKNITTIDNTSPSNDATLPDCLCQDGQTPVGVQGGGSDPDLTVNQKNVTTVKQKNETAIINVVINVSNTGANVTNGNTGEGDLKTTTGDVTNKTNINNGGSDNTLN